MLGDNDGRPLLAVDGAGVIHLILGKVIAGASLMLARRLSSGESGGGDVMGEDERNQKVYKWALSKLRHRVGRGECWDLADQALRHAGAQSSTTTGRDDDYVWGTPVASGAVVPGDILQFRDYSVTTTVTTVVTFSDGSSDTTESFVTQVRPHHTAIVAANNGAKGLVILEQNREPGLPVERSTLLLANGISGVKTTHRSVKGEGGKARLATIVETTSNRVVGWVKAFRPQAKQ
jgi:hypothetical protein